MLRNEFDTFVVKFRYGVEWTSRYATHPCMINLYDAGQGVSPRGKFVQAENWWTPRPTGDLAMWNEVSTEPKLAVLHAPGRPVLKTCTMAGADACPWPKQLFLADKINIETTYKSSWELAKFPFDKQVLSGTIILVNNVAFAADRSRVNLNFTSPLSDYKPSAAQLANLYPGAQWEAKSATLSLNARNHLAVDFEIVMQRASKGPIFKVLLPVLANAGVAMLASRVHSNARLKLLALSMIVAVAMLNPVRSCSNLPRSFLEQPRSCLSQPDACS